MAKKNPRNVFHLGGDGSIMLGDQVVYRQRPFKYIGRKPIRETPMEVHVQYYDGQPEDRVRLQVLCDGTWRISGWPRVREGEKRPREKSFVLSDAQAGAYEYMLGQLQGLVPGKGHRSGEDYGELREAMQIVLHGTSCDGRYSWDNGAPGKWRKLETLAMGLVFRFHDLCNAEIG